MKTKSTIIALFLSIAFSGTHTWGAKANIVHATTRAPSYPYISGDTFRHFSPFRLDQWADFKPEDVTTPSIIFVKSDWHNPNYYRMDYLTDFIKKYHPRIPSRYILITHNGDRPTPDEFIEFLDDPKLIHWYGQNPTITSHPKFTAIPIGIANQYWPHGNPKIFDQIIQETKNQPKKYLLYLNFDIDNNPAKRGLVWNIFKNKSFVHAESKIPHSEYLHQLARSKFVICPEGNGLDCHRTWEALLFGCIPVLKHSPLDSMLADLPVLIINDWWEVTEELLNRTWEEFQTRTFNTAKIYVDYWKQDIFKKLLENS